MKAAAFVVAAALASVTLGGCSKSGTPGEDAGAGANANANAIHDAAAGGGADAGTATLTKPTATAGKGATFGGKYTVTAGTMYVPAEKDWASVKFKNDETKMLGDGEMTIVVDPNGRVSGGTEGGPLGASVLDGHVDNGQLTGTIRRKDAADEGLTGTLLATITGDAIAGTMNLAEANAAVVRKAKLDAKKK